MLERIKQLLEITDNSKDVVLNFLIDKATLRIQKYLNTNENIDVIKVEYELAIIQLVMNTYEYNNSENGKGIKSMTQGQRSISFDDSFKVTFNQEIKDMLPLPKVRFI